MEIAPWELFCPQHKQSMPSRHRANRAALDVRLTTEDLSGLDRWFLPPTSKPATWSDFILDLGH
jgi:diketogulonate reductase-like aldo/keto reductase